MTSGKQSQVVFYFQVHQPYRLERFTFFDIGRGNDYFDDTENERILRRVAEKCYLPMNELLLEQIEKHDGKFKAAMAITGTVLDQLEAWCPEALESFVKLAETGCVEIVCETSHHSLAFLSDVDEFEAQIADQKARIEKLFGRAPTTFRNTELVIDNDVAQRAERLGFTALLGEGADHLLGFKSSHRAYRPTGCETLKLLLRTYERADDIAFRFSNRDWDGWPLTPETFARSLADGPKSKGPEGGFVGLFMDYETFGEHQWRETGIFDFMAALPQAILDTGELEFATPSEIAESFPEDEVEALDIPHPVSWADTERDLTAWLGNHMQSSANEALYALADDVKKAAANGRPELLADWRKLTTSDHVYYMCTKWFSDGDVHKYFSPYTTPHDAFIAFMNVVADLGARVRRALEEDAGDTDRIEPERGAKRSSRKSDKTAPAGSGPPTKAKQSATDRDTR